MAPPVFFKKATLSYPVYSVDFDPYDRPYLLVGGGGGEGRSGVSNKITLLDTATSPKGLEVVSEIELSRDEDSVTSLANLALQDGLLALAGINSSEADQKAGKNEHLRVFEARYPKRRKTTGEANGTSEKSDQDEKTADGHLKFVNKVSLFKAATGPKPEQYQRLLRLSPALKLKGPNKRIGVVTTGLAKEPQLVIFDASRVPPKLSEIINAVPLDEEAADVDISITMPQEFSVVWCSDYDIFEQSVQYDFNTQKKQVIPKNPRRIHSLPKLELSGKSRTTPRQKFRSIRFLTDHHLLVLANLPNKSGAELYIMVLYPTGPAALVFHKILPSHIKQAVGMDVCALDPDEIGSRQFVVAIAGQDISIEIYTINYTRQTDTFTPFRSFTTMRDVHPLQMTAIRFAPFFSPELPNKGSKNAADKAHYIRLASVSMGNTVVLDSLAIQPLDASKRGSRYVLSHPSTERWTKISYSAIISLVVLVTAILIQSTFLPERGQALLATMPAPVQRMFDGTLMPGARSVVEEVIVAPTNTLKDLLALHASDTTKAVIVRDPTDLNDVQVSDREEYLRLDAQARHWEELAEHEQDSWRGALVKAGHWTVDEGEAVLKGMLFSSYAGAVGQAAGEVIREL